MPGAQLCALCDVAEDPLHKTARELGVPKTYTDFTELCADPELDAVVIVSPSAYHAQQIKIALDAGKHVFCEKPLDTTVDNCSAAERAVESHPELVFMLGFMRRYDKSYLHAMQRIRNGDIGRVILVRSYTQDPIASIESAIRFGPHSGGQFLDMSSTFLCPHGFLPSWSWHPAYITIDEFAKIITDFSAAKNNVFLDI